MARQHHLEPGERPFLERFRQQGVIGVGQRSLRQIPGLVPAEMRLIEQDPHQLRYRHRRMRVVELNRDLVGERAPIGIAAAEAPDEIGQRAGDQEILLHEAQALSHAGGIVWIQHAGQRFGRESPSQGADKIAAAELLKVEIVGCSGGP